MTMPSDAQLTALYGRQADTLAAQRARYAALAERFARHFPQQATPRFFSSPGRAEIGGNHTDHQHGRVLAAAVNLDTIAAVAPRDDGVVRIFSEGFDPIAVDLSDLTARPDEQGQTAAVVRGCAARLKEMGRPVGGFDAAASSQVLVGSGLSSSAAFEVLVIAILDGLYGSGDMDPILRAQIAQYAENVYFGKPSGLMDQMASSVGGIVAIDFGPQTPEVTALAYDFQAQGYCLAVVNTGGNHDDLTPAYAAIPAEMRQVAQAFGQETLRGVDPAAFIDTLAKLRGKVPDRALLRAFHFFEENARVPEMVDALSAGALEAFLRLVVASGDSSWEQLQNVWATPEEQPVALALAMSRRFLMEQGAWRVHGGGFAGTILAFVPTSIYDAYCAHMDAVFGAGACCALQIREVGPVELA